MGNPLDLGSAELAALQDLQADASRIDADDPVWDELEQLALVESRETHLRVRVLTPLGRSYPT